MPYVDGFVAAVPAANKQAYIDHAAKAADVFRDHGATRVVECWGDDVPDGEVTSFPMAVKARDDEAIVFSWVSWPDKATRDAGMEKVFADPRMQPDVNPMPLDGRRLIHGGFEVLLEL